MSKFIEVRCEVELPVKYKGVEIEAGYRLGFLVNWNVPLIKDGIKRMVNKL